MLITVIICLLYSYITIGILFSIWFTIHGIHIVDPAAKGASLAFRLIVLPGLILLWPLMANKWLKKTGRNGQNA